MEKVENNSVEVEPFAIDNTTTRSGAGVASQCTVPNPTVAVVRRRYMRHTDRLTYHYHHAP